MGSLLSHSEQARMVIEADDPHALSREMRGDPTVAHA